MCVSLTKVVEQATDIFLQQPETAFCGGPIFLGKWDSKVSDSIRKTLSLNTVTLSAKTETLFAKTETHSAGPVTQSALY